jgi:hypothetical protein
MADTVDTGLLPRTYFKAPRVPFDFRGVAIAILGYIVYWAGGLLLSAIFSKGGDIPGAFLTAAATLFSGLPFLGEVIPDFLLTVFGASRSLDLADYNFWQVLLGGVWFFAIWSFFGQAIHRIASLRIARDEGLTLFEALQFSLKNWVTVLLAPVIVGVAIAFFYGCNAFAGLLISIPVVGQLLGLILIPLAAISTLLILLIALGGIFGLPLIGAAAAWERNGSLDAISRAFSYIFARPLQFFWNYFLIFLFIGVILLVGSWFIWTLTKSVDAGVWDDHLTVAIDRPQRDPTEGSDYADLSREAQDYYVSQLQAQSENPGRTFGRFRGRPFAHHFRAVSDGSLPFLKKLNILVFWAFINLIWFGIFGYAVYWFLGASTSVYADLRADVDGTEEDEIYLEEEEEDFDAFAEAVDKSEPAPTPPPPDVPGETGASSDEAPSTSEGDESKTESGPEDAEKKDEPGTDA